MRCALAGLVVLSSCTQNVPPAAPAPQGWSVSRGFIRDPEGRAVVLRGANVSGRHKDPPYFDFHGAADYARMREQWGMNAVRFLVSWAALEPEKDQYDAKYLDAVAEHVKLATDAGLWVFLDMHQDLYGPGFVGGNGAPKWTCDAATYAAYQPTSPWFFNYLAQPVIACFDGFWKSRELQSHYVEAWRRLAARLKDNPGVIGFDPMNEPYWGSFDFAVFEEKRLAPLYLQVIAAVRSEQPNALAFVEPASSRNLGFASKLPPLGVANVVYTPHSYDADAEQGNGFDEAHRQKLTDNIAALAAEAKALDAALVLGEYGGIASAPGISDYMGAQYGATGARSAGAMYYDYAANDSYALLEADGGEKVVLLDAVARPFPSQVAGEPLGFSFDAASKTFRFSYRPVKGTTVISVPPRTWPGGYSIDCGGCPAKKTAHGVELETAGPGTDVSVVLTGN